MAELRMIGCDHRLVSPSRLEAWSNVRGGEWSTRLAGLAAAKAEGVIAGAFLLSTCNRVELLVDGADAETARRLFFGPAEDVELPVVEACDREAVARLLRITTGLESMVVGETQIAGQVTRAFRAAEDAGLLSKPLHMLRSRVASAARRLRNELPATRPVKSVAALGVHALLEAGPRIGILGAGETAQLALELLRRRRRVADVVVINRTLGRAEALVDHFGCRRAVALDHWLTPGRAGVELDALLCAVDSTERIVDRERAAGLETVVDLSRPSVCARDLQDVDGLEVVDLDVLAQRAEAGRRAQGEAAEAMALHVDARVDTIWEQLLPGRASLAGVVELHLESALAEAELAFRGRLADLDDAHRDLVRELVRRVAKRDAHFHLTDLKQLGAAGARR